MRSKPLVGRRLVNLDLALLTLRCALRRACITGNACTGPASKSQQLPLLCAKSKFSLRRSENSKARRLLQA
jgi:hypothetical protein